MSNHGPIYMPGDAVYYNGNKASLKQALTNKDGKPLKGWIHAPVTNEREKFVVWFPDTKESDSYLIHQDDLTKARPPKAVEKKHEGPVVEHMPVRRRKSEEES